jgi:hypothetical protein
MPKKIQSKNKSRVKQIVSYRPQDPNFSPKRLTVSGVDIPAYVANPAVERIIRMQYILTSGSPTAQIVYSDLVIQDAKNYTGTSSIRYLYMRVHKIKAWAESPSGLSVSQSPYGLQLVDYYSSITIKDKPVTNSRVSAIGYLLPFQVRSILVPTYTTNVIATISCDATIAASTDFVVTVDVSCEFL